MMRSVSAFLSLSLSSADKLIKHLSFSPGKSFVGTQKDWSRSWLGTSDKESKKIIRLSFLSLLFFFSIYLQRPLQSLALSFRDNLTFCSQSSQVNGEADSSSILFLKHFYRNYREIHLCPPRFISPAGISVPHASIPGIPIRLKRFKPEKNMREISTPITLHVKSVDGALQCHIFVYGYVLQ